MTSGQSQAQDRAVYDLRKFEAALPREHQKLAKIIRRCIYVHSCTTDLEWAKVCCETALRHHRTGRASLQHAKTALIHAGIMAYARASERKSRHRPTLILTGKMSAEKRALHDQILQLRDEAVARFGPAGSSEPWSSDHLIIIREGDVWQPAIASHRLLFDAPFADVFYAHLLWCAELAGTEAVKQMAETQEAIATAVKESPDLIDILTQGNLDPEEFGGWEGPILGGSRTGRMFKELPSFKPAST